MLTEIQCGGFHLRQRAPAHLSVVVFKMAQLETLLQFGVVPDPELIESPFSLVQLRQQSDRGAEEQRRRVRDSDGDGVEKKEMGS